MRLIRCLLYMSLLIILGKEMQSFGSLTSDQELEICMATYRPEIDQSQCVKSVNHIVQGTLCCSYKLNDTIER